ncbi:hypothetical protein NDU88_005564 [Pleurodeles waltl]|uniref:Uncharacterized protein n=1 Tax=Pleurodeles waltl TaxID=8319 RepID=A0AAV7PFS0_PLEWA|nr:hypothetical protein NDU88_005564 [Pleurodeles waltl]
MDVRVEEAMRLLCEAGRLDLLADGVAYRDRPVRQAASRVAAAVAACSPPRSNGGRRAPQVQAETESGHMTDENGWDENRTRQTHIGRGWTVAGLRREYGILGAGDLHARDDSN